ncbi:hypothetical protein LX81_03755, partial [Palleronia aestuarii]
IGRMYPRTEAFVARDSHAVDMAPWSLAKPVGAAIVLVVVSTYFVFT